MIPRSTRDYGTQIPITLLRWVVVGQGCGLMLGGLFLAILFLNLERLELLAPTIVVATALSQFALIGGVMSEVLHLSLFNAHRLDTPDDDADFGNPHGPGVAPLATFILDRPSFSRSQFC